MRRLLIRGVAVDRHLAIANQNQFAGFERTDILEAEVQQRHALAGGGEQAAIGGVTERANAERIARDDHIALRIHEHDVVSTVEFLTEVREHLH